MLLVDGSEDIERLQASTKFLNVHIAVIIFVEYFHQVDDIFLETWVVLGTLLDLVQNGINRGFWEHLRVGFHVFLSVLIGLDKHELETNQENSLTENEVLLGVVSAGGWVSLLLSLHESTSDSAGVLVADLVDLDGVVTAVERNDESSGLIIRLSANQLGLESEDVHVLFEHLLHVYLWSFWLQSENGTKRVLWGTITIVRWDSLISDVWSTLGKLDWLLCDTHVVSVPSLGKLIAVIDKSFSAINDNLLTAEEVAWTIVLLILE